MDNTLNATQLRDMFADCDDVVAEVYKFADDEEQVSVLIMYSPGLCDARLVHRDVLPALSEMFVNNGFASNDLAGRINVRISPFSVVSTEAAISEQLFSGKLILFFEQNGQLHLVDIGNPPVRQPSDSQVEVAIIGPRDAFVESLDINIALVRKRLKTNALACEQSIIGTRSQTGIALMYMKDIVPDDTIEEARRRLSQLQIEDLYSMIQLKQALSGKSFNVFPLVGITTRPDFVVESLTKGRFVVLMDGVDTALLAPVNFNFLMIAAEDTHMPVWYTTLNRFIRKAGLMISLLLPGFWIALITYHQEQIPLPLLATITVSREGVPFNAPLEMVGVLILFRLMLEAGSRLPSSIGPSLSVVGGLIVGDAAIRAGLTSPITVVITAMSYTAIFTISTNLLNLSITVAQLLIIALSCVFGMFGFLMGFIAIVFGLSGYHSFGVPYLVPFSPLRFKTLLGTLMQLPWNYRLRRPNFLRPQDPTEGRKKPK